MNEPVPGAQSAGNVPREYEWKGMNTMIENILLSSEPVLPQTPEEAMAVYAILLLIFCASAIYWMILLGLTIANYVVQSLAIMRIAKKFGMKNGWMAFIPFANRYLIGTLAERSDELAHPDEEPRKWGKIYLGVSIAFSALLPVASLIPTAGLVLSTVYSDSAAAGLPYAIAFPLLLLFLLCLAIPTAVIGYLILYRIYRALTGKDAGWMLALSILVTGASTVILAVLGFGKAQPALPAALPPTEAPTEASAENE